MRCGLLTHSTATSQRHAQVPRQRCTHQQQQNRQHSRNHPTSLLPYAHSAPIRVVGCSAEFEVCRFVIHEMETGRTLQLVASSGCRGAIMILYRSSSLSSTEQTHFYSDEAARGCCRVCVAHRTTDDTRDKVAADRHSRACTCACFDRDAKCADLGSKFDFK